MTLELRQYSATKIGQTWTSEDHEFLVTALGRIDQTCIDVWNQIQRRNADGAQAPRRVAFNRSRTAARTVRCSRSAIRGADRRSRTLSTSPDKDDCRSAESIPPAFAFESSHSVCPSRFSIARPIDFLSVGPCRHCYSSFLSASMDLLSTSVSLKRFLTSFSWLSFTENPGATARFAPLLSAGPPKTISKSTR